MRVFILLSLVLASALAASLPAEQRIIGGQPANISQYPYLANILQSVDFIFFIPVCTGTILNNRSILTTASCLPSSVSRIQARVGSSFASSGGTVLSINNMVFHGSYNPITHLNDIGIARTVPGGITFVTGAVMPALYSKDITVPATNSAVNIVGWGRTEVGHFSEQLRHAQVLVLSTISCQNYIGAQAVVPSTMFCTYWVPYQGADVCQGDNGSPILLNNTVVGIVSRPGCGDYFKPSISTRISMYESFISVQA